MKIKENIFYFFIIIIQIVFLSKNSFAYPQLSGNGYFSCTSCHVGTNGGDLLTPYGRSFSEEQIAQHSYEGEAQPLHGTVEIPSWLLLGGHLRLIQTQFEDANSKDRSYFTMQQDIDIGLNIGKIFVYATAAPNDDNHSHENKNSKNQLSKWTARYDVLEFLSLRTGIISPKFGLNIPQHSAYVRQGVGLGTESNKPAIELSYFSEVLEVNLLRSIHNKKIKYTSTEENNISDDSIYVNVSTFLMEKHRFSASYMQQTKDEVKNKFTSLSSSITANQNLRLLTEVNHGSNTVGIVKSKNTNTFLQSIFYPTKGWYPSIIYQHSRAIKESESNIGDKLSFHLSYHPRPHWELVGSIGQGRNLRTFTYYHSGYLLFHYWL